jgi:purine-cytosine permease-like protein
VRRSLPDEQLLHLGDDVSEYPGSTLDAIQQLESQLRLREQEAREFQEWESTMRVLGTPDAIAAVENARPDFSDVLSVTPPVVPSVPVEPIVPAAPFVDPGPPPLPSWGVASPGPAWAPGPEYDFDPAPATELPVSADDPEPEFASALAPGIGDTVEILPERVVPEQIVPEQIVPEQIVPVSPAGPPALQEPEPTPGRGSAAAGAAAAVAGAEFSFDDLLLGLSGADAEHGDSHASRAETAAPLPPLIEPMPIAAGEPVPTDTGSIAIADNSYEQELPDDVDETDRVFAGLGPNSAGTTGVALAPGPMQPPSGPISTVRVRDDEVVLGDNRPARMRTFSLENSGPEPTPQDHRVGRSARLFWLWFASNSSILSVGLGATVFAVGMSLRQSIVAVLAGVALSFIPLGLTTLAGKRSGQPTMIVSRATFGVVGNAIPALIALVTRVYWGAVLLWLLASSVTIVLVGAGLDSVISGRRLLLISLAIAFLVALLVAFAGYPLFARMQLVFSIVSGVLIAGLIVFTWKYVNIAEALSTPDGSWTLTISGAVLVFSFVGLVWANSGADLARYQRAGTSGAGAMLWATFGATLPTFVLIGYGALLAASDPAIAEGFVLAPLDTVARMLPEWYPVPLIAATTLSLLSGIALTLYSGGFALRAIGVRVRRQWSIIIVAVMLGGLALVLTFGVTGGMSELFRDLATTIAVPTAAWAGIFGAEMMIRNRRFDSDSLVRRGGIYADIRWLNVLALLVITGIGYGLTTATVSWLSWQGYGFTALGMPLSGELAASDLGVLVALALGILTPVIAGVPAIRRQEAARA